MVVEMGAMSGVVMSEAAAIGFVKKWVLTATEHWVPK